MAKQYKRKIYITNNTRDSEKCNDHRKSFNSSERLRGKRDIVNTVNEMIHADNCHCVICEPIPLPIIHGDMLSSLIRLGLIDEHSETFYDLLFQYDNVSHYNFYNSNS